MNSRNKKLDDLTVIKGIGPARQEWLRNNLGINTYQNLVDLPPAEIVSRLKSDGQIFSQADVELWIAQAKALASGGSPSSPREWQPFATFVIEFQSRQDANGSDEFCTVVQHMESDVEQKWPGIDTDQFPHWIEEQAGIKVVKFEHRHRSASVVSSPGIVVQQLQAFQPPDTTSAIAYCTPDQPFQGFVHQKQPLDLHVVFSIIGCDLTELHNAGTQCVSQVYARHMPGGEFVHIGDTPQVPVKSGQTSYATILPNITLDAGMYRIKVLTRILITPPVFVSHEGHFLQVV